MNNKLTKLEMTLIGAALLAALFIKFQYDQNVKLKAKLSLEKAQSKSDQLDVKINDTKGKIKDVKERKLQPTNKSASEFWNGLYR